MLTNRQLSRVYGLSLNHLRKQAVLSLGRDPEADKSGGVRRKYSLDDAFIIHLFGFVLVREMRMNLTEAKNHIDNIREILTKENLTASKIDPNDQDWQYFPQELIAEAKAYAASKPKRGISSFPGIDLIIWPGNKYSIKYYVEVNTVSSNERIKFTTFSMEKNYPPGRYKREPGPVYFIRLVAEILSFRRLIA